MRIRAFIALAVGATTLWAGIGPVMAANFYQQKTIRVLVNYTAGGAADLEARVFAKHASKHIPGNPKLIVQNMDGAGGMNGTNFVGRDTTRDGTLMGYLTGAGTRAALTPDAFRTDFRAFEFVALSPGAAIYFARSDTKPGIKTPKDILKAENLFVGGVGSSSSKDLTSRLTLDMLGVKHGYIPGYAGTTAARMALEKGEISFYSENRPAYQTLIAPLVASGVLLPIYYDPSFDGDRLTIAKSVADLPVAPFHEFYRAVRGREPGGKLWEAYKTILSSNNALLRVIVLPPGAPKEAVEALRMSIAGLGHDQEFAQEAERLLGFVPEYVTGPQLNKQVQKMIEIDPEMRSFIESYAAAGG